MIWIGVRIDTNRMNCAIVQFHVADDGLLRVRALALTLITEGADRTDKLQTAPTTTERIEAGVAMTVAVAAEVAVNGAAG